MNSEKYIAIKGKKLTQLNISRWKKLAPWINNTT